ncbi:MAG: MotA/TolQ/ExbB proton channel family protein [Rhodospirillaceae bacterium]|nr:MotA/TolQ/ExbB proton channel family protein [Rhodospirillaceae bacterium]
MSTFRPVALKRIGVAAAILCAVATGAWAQAQPAGQGAAPAATAPAAAATAPVVAFPNLSQIVQRSREAERKINQDREARFQSDLRSQEEKTRQAIARRNAAEARSAALDKAYAENDARIAEVNELLTQKAGNLGELFGVTRQVAGDAATVLQASLLTTEFKGLETEERSDFLRRLAGAKELPSLPELERMWQELLREMVSSGKVVAYRAPVAQIDETVREDVTVVRVGPFTAVADGKYLGYTPGARMLTALDGSLGPGNEALARGLEQSLGKGGYVPAVVDPARGSIMGLLLDRPTVVQRIQHGEAVGYVILAVGFLGVALAMVQGAFLILTRGKVRRQLQNIDHPTDDNPLGRVLIAGQKAKAARVSAEVLELQISEAVLRELPALERFQSFLRLAVSAGPLLGLIGTVIGMIITFQVIVASGTSDPKLMATGIGQAMIATVLGLGIAIPLLFINSWLGALSRKVIQVLDEESQALLSKSLT